MTLKVLSLAACLLPSASSTDCKFQSHWPRCHPPSCPVLEMLHFCLQCFLFIFFIILFIYYLFCAGSSLLRRFFSTCGEWGRLSSCGMQASHHGGFSYCRAQAPGCLGFSRRGSWALEHRLNRCGTGLFALGYVESSRIRDQTGVTCIGRRILYIWAMGGSPTVSPL